MKNEHPPPKHGKSTINIKSSRSIISSRDGIFSNFLNLGVFGLLIVCILVSCNNDFSYGILSKTVTFIFLS